jgi:beta-galactosidase
MIRSLKIETMIRRIITCCFIIATVTVKAQTILSPGSNTREVAFDSGWRFVKDSTVHAEIAEFDDSKWRTVDLPHDWSIEDLPEQVPGKTIGAFDKSSVAEGATGFAVGGTGWYRKEFTLPLSTDKKSVEIHFDGVYMNSDVWINGHHLGNHPYGYTPFYYELTKHLKYNGQKNVIAVRVENKGKNSRWYSGSGIYRHVWLTFTDPVHIDTWGVYVRTEKISKTSALLVIKSVVKNDQPRAIDVVVTSNILSHAGKLAGTKTRLLKLQANGTETDSTTFVIKSPQLWNLGSPKLYKVITQLQVDNTLKDQTETTFGIRTIKATAVDGFMLNGKRVILKGGCIHHDNGLLGAVALDRAEQRKIDLLKANGFNAIRTSHNPPSHQLLDYCDKVGMLVIDEAFDCWEEGKNPQDYHLYFDKWFKQDLQSMILRDRNHPAVVIWSIGNEIPERVDSSGVEITKSLAAIAHTIDPSRPVTEALCFLFEKRNRGRRMSDFYKPFALLDVAGYNYLQSLYPDDHAKFPDRVMLGTESYPKDALVCYDLAVKNPYVIGDFVWTAMDYIGEASIGNSHIDSTRFLSLSLGWPWYNAWCGDLDLIGNKKPQSYYRDVVWGIKPVTMLVHRPIPPGMKESVSPWGWPDEWPSWSWSNPGSGNYQVRVFSRAPLVRLYLNGRLIGEQKIPDNSITAAFNLPFEPGILEAVNVENGKETGHFKLETAGEPKHLKVVADRQKINANRNDLAYITISITDDKGNIVPDADTDIKLSVSGEGSIAAAGNAYPKASISFHNTMQRTWKGTCLVILRPGGKKGQIKLNVSSTSLGSENIVVDCQ